MNLLLLGPRAIRNNPEMSSGTIVLFEDLLKELDKTNVTYKVIDTNKKNYLNLLFAYIAIFFQIIVKQRSCTHISLHSSHDYMVFGILIILFGKIFNKKTSLRKFGGEAMNTFTNANTIKKYYLKILFSQINDLFLETKYLVSFFSKINKNTFWFPNTRKRTLEPHLPRKFKKKFVFISHVIKEKGIDEIIKASKNFNETYTIDIYGPILHEEYKKEIFHKEKVSYKGPLAADKVMTKLNEYDVLLLPSYKEGYPGIIIEAYSLGIPVIATSLQGISEIVDPYKTGILIELKNVKDLIDAIQFFDEDNYANISKQAYKKFDAFKSDEKIKEYIKKLKNA